NGSIDVTAAAGGSGAYEYSIDGVTFDATTTFTGLAAGPYTISVRDLAAPACIVTINTTITEPVVITATVSPTDATCAAATNGSIDVTAAAGGSGAYEYSIDGVTFDAT